MPLKHDRHHHHHVAKWLHPTLMEPDPVLVLPLLLLLLVVGDVVLVVAGERVEVVEAGEVVEVVEAGEAVEVVEVVGDVVEGLEAVSLTTPLAVVTVPDEDDVVVEPVLPVSKESVPWIPFVFPAPSSSNKSPAANTLFLLIKPFQEFQ